MELWISLILFVLAAAGIVLLAGKMRASAKKTTFIAAIAVLAVVAVFMLGYALVTVVFVGGISAGAGIPPESIVALEPDANGDFYLYGIEKSGGRYYVAVIAEYVETPEESALRYLPLADELLAEFQHPEEVGAWSPYRYLSADELASAFEDGRVLVGARFAYSSEGGLATELAEYSYYG